MPRVVCVTEGYIFSDAQGRLWDGGRVFGCQRVFFGTGRKLFLIPEGLIGGLGDIDGHRA